MGDRNADAAAAALKGLRVLVLEDQLLIALDIRRRLESLGCSPIGPARDVEAALRLLEDDRPDAALLDENLAGAEAGPVASALSTLGVPFALISGYARSPSTDATLAGAHRVTKPATTRSICTALLAILP